MSRTLFLLPQSILPMALNLKTLRTVKLSIQLSKNVKDLLVCPFIGEQHHTHMPIKGVDNKKYGVSYFTHSMVLLGLQFYME